MGFDSVFVTFVAALFLDRITLRRSGGLLYWAAVKKHRGSQKLLNWNTETLKTLANTRNAVASEAQQETQRTETTKNPEKKPNYCDETKIGQLRKKGEYWSEERGESRDVLKGCESVKEEDRIVEEEEVVNMMTNVGIYEFNAKDLIGHGAFAVVYKGRLKSVSCATLFLLSAVCCVYFSQQGKDLLICVFDFKPSQPVTLDLHSLTFSCSAIQQQLTLFSSAQWLLIITSRPGLGIIDYWSYSLEMMAQHPPPPIIAILVINILAFIVASAI